MADTATETKTNIRPLGDRVVVRTVERESQTSSGIYLPDTVQEKPQEALVIAVGPGKLLDNGNRAPIDVKAGDKVLFSKYADTEVKQLNEEYMILRESDMWSGHYRGHTGYRRTRVGKRADDCIAE